MTVRAICAANAVVPPQKDSTKESFLPLTPSSTLHNCLLGSIRETNIPYIPILKYEKKLERIVKYVSINVEMQCIH